MKPRTTTSSARCGVAIVCGIAVVCGLALLAAGCGASASSSGSAPASAASSSAPANSALCADAAALRASLDKLRHVNVGAGMADEITADLNEVKTALTTL